MLVLTRDRACYRKVTLAARCRPRKRGLSLTETSKRVDSVGCRPPDMRPPDDAASARPLVGSTRTKGRNDMSSERNRRVVLRTAAGVAGAVSLPPLPPAGNEDYQAVSRALGTTINVQPAGGNTPGTSPATFSRTSPAVAPAKSGRPTPASATEDPSPSASVVPRLRPPHRYGTLGAPEVCGIAFWSRPAGPLLVRRPLTDPHPKGKDPS
ncbi:hypothetical protein GCM10027072_45790 [Streptomyces bullii]